MPIINGINKKYGDLTENDLNILTKQSHPGLDCTEDDIVKWIAKNEDIRFLNLLALEEKKVVMKSSSGKIKQIKKRI